MKGNELIEKILNKEIKSGTMIKVKQNYPCLEWEKELCFNGNWFSEGKYYPGVPRYDDIILHLCSEYITFEIIEDNKIEKIDLSESGEIVYKEDWEMLAKDFNRNCNLFVDKINEIIDYLEENK